MGVLLRFLTVAAIVSSPICAAGTTLAARPPTNVLFDTDMGGDCDDVGALFVLHGAVERGEAKLLATIGCVSSDSIAPCLDAINTWFGRGDIPVGTLEDPGFLPDAGFTADIARRYPHRLATRKDYPGAVALYRRILAAQPDGSAVVVAVGPLRNLANLLKSSADATSPLDGLALVAKKVAYLHVMGGKYPPSDSKKEGEYNFVKDAASAALVCSTWPTPVLFNGEGGSTNSGRRVTFEMPEHNPLSFAYAAYPGVGHGGDRLSWDPISCLVAVRGADPWFAVVGGGTNVVDPATGINVWRADRNRNHSYLKAKAPKAEVETALEDMMVAGRGRPVGLTWNTAHYAKSGMCQIVGSGDARAIRAFDGDAKTSWSDGAASSWLSCRYVDGRKYPVSSYSIDFPDLRRVPRTIEFSGSDDGGLTWTILDRSKIVGAVTERTRRRTFAVPRPVECNMYRLTFAAASPDAGVTVAEIELNQEIDCRPGIAVETIALDRNSPTVSVDGRATIVATVGPTGTWDREVAWVSSDPGIAEVRRIGERIAVAVGKKPGTCTLTASIGNAKRTCEVTVTAATLPSGWRYDELGSPSIPGSISVAAGTFALTGCGHAMTSWWERVRDRGAFASRAIGGDVGMSVRLTSLAPNVGGPAYQWDNRPPTVSGLMIRESTTAKTGRYVLIQVSASGNLECRWRDKTGDVDDNQSKALGKVTLPIHLKLVRTGKEISVFTSVDGIDWGAAKVTRAAAFDDGSRIGPFVCSGNAVAAATAVYDRIGVPK